MKLSTKGYEYIIMPFRSSLFLILSLCIGWSVLPSASWADLWDDGTSEEEEIPQNPLTGKGRLKIDRLEAGAQTELIVDLELLDGFHAYKDKFKLDWLKPQGVHVGQWTVSPTEKFKDVVTGKMKDGLKGRGQLISIIEIDSSLKPGDFKAQVQVTYQACTKKYCLFPKKILVEIPFTIIPMEASTASPASVEQETTSGFSSSLGKALKGELSFSEALKHGRFFAFLFIFLAGVLTSFTPCVYPMIPITLAVIGARSADVSRLKSLSLSIVYVLGIGITFSSLGVVAALTGSLFGSFLSHPLVVGALALIFTLMGLSMYGVFELQAPAFIRNKTAAQKSTGYPGAFIAGLVSGIVAGPCVGPVLVGVLTHVGESQNATYGFSLLFTYALGMGLLFIALGVSSGLLNKLPKAGGWMDGVKFLFGSIMIGMALYYVKPLFSAVLHDGLVGVALILIASSFGAFKPNAELSGRGRLVKGLMIATLMMGVLFTARAFFPETFRPKTVVSQSSEAIQWVDMTDEALTQAQKEGRPVIIDFWAEWCAACKELEEITFKDPVVVEARKDIVWMKYDATDISPRLEELQKRYGILGLPTIIFIDREGNVRDDLTLTGFEDGPAFKKRMQPLL